MTEKELQEYLLREFPEENTRCEWKEMKNLKNSFSNDPHKDVISYVSAIANMNGGHLIIGVVDKTLEIVGTDLSGVSFNNAPATTQSATYKLIEKCKYLSSEGLYIQEFVTDDTNKTVWVINIPRHQPRRPVLAHMKAWQRIEDSLVEMTQERMDAILSEPIAGDDWSAQVVEDATLEDLDPKAIRFARDKYKELHPSKEQEVDGWDDMTFLNKAHITRQGKITNTSLILVGREESEHFLSPAVCKIRWQLKDGSDENKDFRILSIPMILAVEEFTNLVRNTNYTYTISGNIFPESMQRYSIFTLREPLCNCIAHQSYQKPMRIEIVEYEDEKLIFRNYGSFLPSSVEDVVANDFPESEYRNPALVEAMRNVKMAETEGGGIRKLFLQQKKRFFPMPKYDISNNYVVCEIQGKILDENFAKILVNNSSLTLQDIILLDKVQKHKPITDDALTRLRSKGYVEGRKPNVYLSAKLAKDSKNPGLKSSYIKNKGFNDSYFKNLILEFIQKYGRASRTELEELLMDKLSDAMSEQQKINKITNLLASLRKGKKIIIGEKRLWYLVQQK
jgi:ATP-dependent DNA helicase RecG